MSCPVLYSFRRCPYAMRARLALLASQQTVELREVVLASKPTALLDVSPKGTVPVMVLPKGQVIEQSLEIMLWTLQNHDPLCWLAPAPYTLTDQLDWIHAFDLEFKPLLDRYKYPHRFGLSHGTDPRDQGATYLDKLEQLLQSNTYLHAGHFTLADASIAPFVRQFAHTDNSWFLNQPWPRLQAWLYAFETSAIFLTCMEKYTAWAAGQDPVFWGPR